jgi:Flp pilus assembly protein TadD
MNRTARRAGLASSNAALNQRLGDRSSQAAAIAQLMAQARSLHQCGQANQAQGICNEILTREPAHVDALNLLGLILQASARHKLAMKTLNRAIAADASNAACHYDLACSLQALGRDDEAAVHFNHAITLGAALSPSKTLFFEIRPSRRALSASKQSGRCR